MKKYILLFMLSCFHSVSWAQDLPEIDITWIPKQTQAESLRYWFDDDSTNVMSTPVTNGNYAFDTSSLLEGLHTVHYQIVDNTGMACAPYSSVFMRTVSGVATASKIAYWFDGDSTEVVNQSITGGEFTFDASPLLEGLHSVHCQLIDNTDMACAPYSAVFMKTVGGMETANKISYWFDDDTTKVATVTIGDSITMIDASSQWKGLHTLHYQLVNDNGDALTPYSALFMANKITKQRYWFDNDTTQIYETKFVSGIQMMDVSALDDGEHTLNLLVVDEEGVASEVQTATFIKEGGDIRILIVRRHYTDEDIAKAQQNPNILVVKWENGETLPLSIRDGMNPNLITYVEDGVEIEGGFKNSRNVVQNGKANELMLTDRSPLLITEPFTASKAQYTRHFEKETTIGDAAGWESIVLPYPVQKITTEDGRALAPFGSPIPADVNFWLGRMVNDGFEHATKILANVPYVIAVPNSNSYRDEYNVEGNVTFTSTSVKVHATDEETANYSIFKPTYEEVADYADLYAINDDEYDTHPAGSVFVRGLRAIRPFEGYITKDFVGGAAPRTIIPIMSNDETGIVDVTRKPDNGKVYTIDGRRVNSSTLSTGLYIINGRKVVVK